MHGSYDRREAGPQEGAGMEKHCILGSAEGLPLQLLETIVDGETLWFVYCNVFSNNTTQVCPNRTSILPIMKSGQIGRQKKHFLPAM